MLDDRTLAAAATVVGVDALSGQRKLSGSDRSAVSRVADERGTSYVVKQHLAREGGTFAREPAGQGESRGEPNDE